MLDSISMVLEDGCLSGQTLNLYNQCITGNMLQHLQGGNGEPTEVMLIDAHL